MSTLIGTCHSCFSSDCPKPKMKTIAPERGCENWQPKHPFDDSDIETCVIKKVKD